MGLLHVKLHLTDIVYMKTVSGMSTPFTCRLIRADRPDDRVERPYKLDAPWGQPQPVTRDQQAHVQSPTARTSGQQLFGAESLSAENDYKVCPWMNPCLPTAHLVNL